mgnify:CR=1 FL=1|tara:strand:+ start:757 stop:2022 length:1266 start_codon:yes stop_codon:yes gene_type:complete
MFKRQSSCLDGTPGNPEEEMVIDEPQELEGSAKRACTENEDEDEDEDENKDVLMKEANKNSDGAKIQKVADVQVRCAGDINRVPLTLSDDGNRAWARRREPPFQLQVANLGSGQVKWRDTTTPITLGAQGLTRCGAHGDYFVMQKHQDGMVVFTDGDKFTETLYLFWNRSNNTIEVVSQADHEASPRKNPEFAICTAMACVGLGLGFAAIIEDHGLVYVNIAQFVYSPYTVVDIDTSCPGNIITSLSVNANQIAYCIGNGEHDHTRSVVVCNILETGSKAYLRIPNMNPITNLDSDEQIWQVSLGADCVCVITTEQCMWVTLKSKVWKTSSTKGVVAASISALTRTIAFLTVLGDCFMVHADCDRVTQRLKDGSRIQPFYTSHTRDGVVAWGSEGCAAYEVVRAIKCGGEIHQISKGFVKT